jgi:PIN domain nuclease of toxin-antitoxin system
MVLDTHALIWWLAEPARLSAKARRNLQAASGKSGLVASAASILEISTLVRRGRLTLAVPVDQWLADVQAMPELRFEPVTPEIAARAGGFDDALPGDPIDRLIVATALVLKLPLVSADSRLRSLDVIRTIW